MAKDLNNAWLRNVVDNLVKPLVEDGEGEERKVMEEFEAFHQVSSCAADTCRAVLLRAFDLAGVPASPTPYTDADKLERVAIDVAGRAVDAKILKVSESSGIARSWAYAAGRAAWEDETAINRGHVVAYLEKRGAIVFEDEKVGYSGEEMAQGKLLMMRLQRVMADQLGVAPRPKLLRNWVKAKRDKGEWAVDSEAFEAVVDECLALAKNETELRELDAKKAKEAAEAKARKDALSSAGEDSDSDAEGGVEPDAKRARLDALSSAGETSEDEEEKVESFEQAGVGLPKVPPPQVWGAWSTTDAFAFLATSMAAARSPLSFGADDVAKWHLTGKVLEACSSGNEVAEQCGLDDRELKSAVAAAFERLFKKKLRLSFGGHGTSDGSFHALRPEGATSTAVNQKTKFGSGVQKWSAKEIASKKARRIAWHGMIVMYMEDEVERFGMLYTSRVRAGGIVQFKMQPMEPTASDEWWPIEKALQGIANHYDHVTTLQNSGEGEVDLFHMLRKAAKGNGGARLNPQRRLKDSTTSDLDRILEEAATNYSPDGNPHPLAFDQGGIRSGADLRVLLLAVNLGGREGQKVVNSEVCQTLITVCRAKLGPKDSAPPDTDIINFVFGSKKADNYAVFNKCNKRMKMASSTPTKQVQQLHATSGGETISQIVNVGTDDRKKQSIQTLQDARFASMRWMDCLKVFHGTELALRWWSTLEQMQDDLLATNCASEGIRPVAEVWSAVWTDLSGALFRAARAAERDGTHAGVAAGAIDLMPADWSLRRAELVMDLRLEWMQALAAKIDTATASQPTRGGRLSEADINTIVTKLGKGGHKGGGGGQLVVRLPNSENQKGNGGGGGRLNRARRATRTRRWVRRCATQVSTRSTRPRRRG
jgi:hypothetical protein